MFFALLLKKVMLEIFPLNSGRLAFAKSAAVLYFAKSAGVILPRALNFYHSDGCEQCENLGYKGRLGIYELLEVTEKIQELIFKQTNVTDFKKAAAEQGMLTMAQDGLLKALEGLTDVEEVYREGEKIVVALVTSDEIDLDVSADS